MKPTSLRARLLAGILLLVTLGLVGTDVALYVTLDSHLEASLDDDLAATAEEMRQKIEPTLFNDRPVVGFSFPARLVRPVSGALVVTPGRGGDIAIAPGGGIRTYEQSGDGGLGARFTRGEVPVGYSDLDIEGVPSRVLYRQFDDREDASIKDEFSGVVVVAPRDTHRATLNQLLVAELVATGVALIAVAALSLAVIRVGLRPVGAIAEAATAVAAGDRDQRIPVPPRSDEIGRLAVVLNQAFDQRRIAEDQLRRFVADASHELRTPMTTIAGWADLYFQGGLPEPDGVETAMTRIAEKSAEVGVLVEDLLLLARLDERRPLERTPVDLAALAAEVCADARVLDADRPLTLDAPEPATVLGDPDRLRQVVRNLVGNAFRHTPDGTAVRVAAVLASDRVLLTVADDGPGISEDDRAHVFERFYRAGTTTPSRVGAGLGLAIVEAIVRAHDGTVTLEPGTGATFTVSLPAATP
ncbi:sensor histidine kinase [Cryptosporangium minutisporangium]|uniref:histidine kinase n=1 Tax=Cryptosporangium minutisporangium TaxID=113569 RepID=A0ABP6T516_9ACTN